MKELEATEFCEKAPIHGPSRFRPVVTINANQVSTKIVSGFLEEGWVSMTFKKNLRNSLTARCCRYVRFSWS